MKWIESINCIGRYRLRYQHTQLIIGFATSNPHKLRETQQCVKAMNPNVEVVGLPPLQEVEETGATFCDNALIKLKAALAQPVPETITHIIAEDAGLIIDALAGQFDISPFPGIYSDRWFSPEVQQHLFGKPLPLATYTEKNQGILKLMQEKTDRSARYESCMACYNRRTGETILKTGTVSLTVAETPKGADGFGYDPIMIPVKYDPHRTMAELSPDEKNRISHRFQALSQLLAFFPI